MSASRQTRLVELHRQAKIVLDAVRALERSLARELGTGTSSAPDDLAERIRGVTRQIVRRQEKMG